MKKKYIIPNTQIILLDTKQPLLTMSISDTDTDRQFAPEYNPSTEF